MFSTSSFNINIIRAAVEEYQGRHGGLGNIVVISTYISPYDYTPQGYAESALDGVIIEVERIARKLAYEVDERLKRTQGAHEQYVAGEISWEEFERVYMFG